MIQENFIEFKSKTIYEINKEELSPESIIFISEPGKECIITLGIEYNLVPSDGKQGLILKRYAEGFGWSDEKDINVSRTLNLSSIPPGFNFVVTVVNPTSSSNNSMQLNISGNMTKGLEMHIIIENLGSIPYTVLIPTEGDYINCGDQENLDIPAGKIREINIISDGKIMYVRAV